MDDDPDMSVTAKLQQVMSTAKESGLKVQQIFSYFKPNGKLEGDITPEDFGAAMHKLGWKCTDEQLKTLLDDLMRMATVPLVSRSSRRTATRSRTSRGRPRGCDGSANRRPRRSARRKRRRSDDLVKVQLARRRVWRRRRRSTGPPPPTPVERSRGPETALENQTNALHQDRVC